MNASKEICGRDMEPGKYYRVLGSPTSPTGLPWDKKLVRYPFYVVRIESCIYMTYAGLPESSRLFRVGADMSVPYQLIGEEVDHVLVVDNHGDRVWGVC